MNQLGFYTWMVMEHERRHQELLNEIEQSKLVKEALKSEKPKTHRINNILAAIGKELTNIGSGLGIRFTDQPDGNPTLNQQGNPGGCS